MNQLEGRIKKASLNEGDPEKNPYGVLDVTITCLADGPNMASLQILRGQNVIVVSQQLDLSEANE